MRRTDICAPAHEIFRQLDIAGQEPRWAGNLLGCTVISARQRGRLGTFQVYVRDDGAWTHSLTRVAYWDERARHADD